jgi:D-alanine--poly(phosphoribitol) ligase subunit 1
MASTDIYTVAFGGCTTHIVPKMYYAFPAMLVNYIAENKVTFLMWVPTAMAMIANTKAFDINDMSSIKKVNFGGEVMPIKVLREWQKHIPGAYYVNGYGSTEMTDGGTYYRIDREFDDNATLPIGKPYPNVDALVLDENNKLIEEPDIAGELCIRSPSLSYGYYNDPERTKEVFVQNPLNTAYEEKIYRTGDLVKYNSYGELEYVGRKDFQIKHRGQRIELGEIEANVLSVDGVEECACLYNQKKERIVLFYSGRIEQKELGAKLKELLPPYMLPGKRHQLEKMPHNLNGKIDRAALKADIDKK